MRITWHPSTGRGEYEVHGEFGDLTPWSLLNHQLILRLDDRYSIDTKIAVRKRDGKPRLRMDEAEGCRMQLARQFAAAMLLPKPDRSGKHTIIHINLSNVELTGRKKAVISTEEVVMGTRKVSKPFDVKERWAAVLATWPKKGDFPATIAEMLTEHERLIKKGGTLPESLETLIAGVQIAVGELGAGIGTSFGGKNSDPLPAITKTAAAVSIDSLMEKNPETRQRTIKALRKSADRGSEGERFSKAVKAAYDFRCFVCGHRFPPLGKHALPGVESAHILPWHKFDVGGAVQNGLCLCRQHHWALDEGLIEIRFDGGHYFVKIPDAARKRAGKIENHSTLEYLETHEIEVPDERLPANRNEWPSPQFLDQLRELLSARRREG